MGVRLYLQLLVLASELYGGLLIQNSKIIVFFFLRRLQKTHLVHHSLYHEALESEIQGLVLVQVKVEEQLLENILHIFVFDFHTFL